jgi:hypothetical protein
MNERDIQNDDTGLTVQQSWQWQPTAYLATFSGLTFKHIRQWWVRADGYGEWRPIEYRDDNYARPSVDPPSL